MHKENIMPIKLKEFILTRKSENNPRWDYKLLRHFEPFIRDFEKENNIQFNVDYYELPDNKEHSGKKLHVQVLHLSLPGKFGDDAVATFTENDRNMPEIEFLEKIERSLERLDWRKKGTGQND